MALPNWEFPTIKKIEAIREYDGDPGKLEDFVTSVDAFLYSRDYPLTQGGWVKPDAEGGFEFHAGAPFPDNNAAALAGFRSNYKYGGKFCVMLAERLTGGAREWWITTSSKNVPNCWRPAPAGQRPTGVVEVPFLHTLRSQFQDTRKHETALLALDSLKWDPSTETVPVFKTRVNALFSKGGITEFNGQQAYLLRVLTDTLSRQVKRPGTAVEFWSRLEEAVATEESIKANKTASSSCSTEGWVM